MRATDFNHDDCLVGDKRLRYDRLIREWRCAECGGRLGVYWAAGCLNKGGWCIRCGRCHSDSFIHERQQARQQAEAAEVLDGLPPELVATFRKGD